MTAIRAKGKAMTSPRLKARMAGALWLIVIAAGASAVAIRSSLIVRVDAAATAANILASESLFRLAFVGDLIGGACYMGVTVILYDLMKPVSRTPALLAALFGLAGVVIGTATFLNHLVPVVVLADAPYLAAFTAGQLQAQAYVSLQLYGQGYSIAMVYFGLQCVLIGYLIVRSTFLPRLLGVLLAFGGASYVISSLADFLSPAFGAHLAPFILPLAVVG